MNASLLIYLQRQFRMLRNVENDVVVFRVDDQGSQDRHYLFCQIELSLRQDGLLGLDLSHAPVDQAVRQLVESAGGQIQTGAIGTSLTIILKPSQSAFIRKLAKAIRRLVGRGQTYLDRNWRWICPRTADSLERLAANLDEYRRGSRQVGDQQRATASSHWAY